VAGERRPNPGRLKPPLHSHVGAAPPALRRPVVPRVPSRPPGARLGRSWRRRPTPTWRSTASAGEWKEPCPIDRPFRVSLNQLALAPWPTWEIRHAGTASARGPCRRIGTARNRGQRAIRIKGLPTADGGGEGAGINQVGRARLSCGIIAVARRAREGEHGPLKPSDSKRVPETSAGRG
jgi:hypothetical protein